MQQNTRKQEEEGVAPGSLKQKSAVQVWNSIFTYNLKSTYDHNSAKNSTPSQVC